MTNAAVLPVPSPTVMPFFGSCARLPDGRVSLRLAPIHTPSAPVRGRQENRANEKAREPNPPSPHPLAGA
jgi:hypothetical protein